MIVFFILSPFLVGVLAAWLINRYPRRAGILATWPAIVALVLANELRATVAEGARLVEVPWAPSLGLSLSFNLGGLGVAVRNAHHRDRHAGGAQCEPLPRGGPPA